MSAETTLPGSCDREMTERSKPSQLSVASGSVLGSVDQPHVENKADKPYVSNRKEQEGVFATFLLCARLSASSLSL